MKLVKRSVWYFFAFAQLRFKTKLAEHENAHPVPMITRLDGTPLTDDKGRPRKDAPKVEELLLDRDPRSPDGSGPEPEPARVA